MTRASMPTIQCDGDDGMCTEWAIDYWVMSVSTVDGVKVTRSEPSPGWFSNDDGDRCPEHMREDVAW